MYKPNEMLKTFLLEEDKFVSEMHLRQPGSTYVFFRTLAKNKERIQKI